ncbi:MAG: transporter substrate-binding domain-containing protein [Pseudomonadota bacterium]
MFPGFFQRALLGAFVFLHAFGAASADAQRIDIPNFWNNQDRFIKPDTSSVVRLRFLTTTDFPPFNFIDDQRRLVGFHVDLARAICAELELSAICQIQALPFSDLEKTLKDGKGEAILAGLAITSKSRERLAFSRAYFRLPAKFIARQDSDLKEPMAEFLRDKKLGVVTGTAHAAYAQKFFPGADVKLFADEGKAIASLEKSEIEAVFSSGLSLSNALHRGAAAKCCKFVGGPYLSPFYFGHGMAIALRLEDEVLRDAINFALHAINEKGTFAELYLRYFPVGIF